MLTNLQKSIDAPASPHSLCQEVLSAVMTGCANTQHKTVTTVRLLLVVGAAVVAQATTNVKWKKVFSKGSYY